AMVRQVTFYQQQMRRLQRKIESMEEEKQQLRRTIRTSSEEQQIKGLGEAAQDKNGLFSTIRSLFSFKGEKPAEESAEPEAPSAPPGGEAAASETVQAATQTVTTLLESQESTRLDDTLRDI